jgi:catechol 2,3-dioxygenase-like lactoylglutathione lyase family enzyme
MQHQIDHVVLCVHDLDRARAFYERLGFTMTPRAQHPFGTSNHLAQLQGSFIELLAVTEPARIVAPAPGRFSFGGFNARFLRQRQGMSMLVFPSDDARADQREFAARGLGAYAPVDFARTARLPDGGEATVAFSLAFATDPGMPGAAFFACQQHAPQHFWKPDYQRHANRAAAICEVMMVADAPDHAAAFLARLLGRQAVAGEEGLRIALAAGAITIMNPIQYRKRCPLAPCEPGTRFAGFRVAVDDVAEAEAILRAGKVPFRHIDDALQVAPDDAFGAVVELGVAA